MLHGEQGGGGPGGHADLAVGALDVRVGRLDRDPQPVRDLLGLEPAREHAHHLGLALGQPGRALEPRRLVAVFQPHLYSRTRHTHRDLGRALAGADVVVHLAWLFQPTHRPDITWRANVDGSRRVFEAVAAADVPALVHASSVGAYSPRTSEQPVDESWPTHGVPTAAYSREKAYVERTLNNSSGPLRSHEFATGVGAHP